MALVEVIEVALRFVRGGIGGNTVTALVQLADQPCTSVTVRATGTPFVNELREALEDVTQNGGERGIRTPGTV